MAHHLLRLFFIVVPALPGAVTTTVCASGCDHTSFTAAVAAATGGTPSDPNIIEIAAGYIAPSTETVFHVTKSNLIIRTSAWRSLPPRGTRIDPVVHAPLMATIAASTGAITAPILVGNQELNVPQNGVNTSTDEIQFSYSLSPVAANDKIACFAREDKSIATLPSGIPDGRLPGGFLFVRSVSGTNPQTVTLSATRGGPLLDLQSVGSSTSSDYNERPLCVLFHQVRNVTFQGVVITVAAAATSSPQTLVAIGFNASPRPYEQGPFNINFQHVVVTGKVGDYTGPTQGFQLFGGDGISIRDSVIDEIRREGTGFESRGIGMLNSRNVDIINNTISAASLNLIVGGSWNIFPAVMANIRIVGNYLVKRPYYLHKFGSGAPSGACYPGSIYTDTSVSTTTCATAGACYTCSAGGTYAASTTRAYVTGYFFTKNLLELKECDNCLIEGNKMEFSPVDTDTGQGWCFGISTVITPPDQFGGSGPASQNRNVTFRYNHGTECFGGIVLSHGTYNPFVPTDYLAKGVVFEHNLVTNMGRFPEASIHATTSPTSRRAVSFSSSSRGAVFRKNTLRIATSAGAAMEYGILIYPQGQTPYSDRQLKEVDIRDNIIPGSTGGNLFSLLSNPPGYAVTQDCVNSTGLGQFMSGIGLRNSVFVGNAAIGFLSGTNCNSYASNATPVAAEASVGFTSASDSSLTSSSPYSARNGSPTMLSTDTTDIGPDTVEIGRQTTAAVAGVTPWEVAVTPGATRAALRFAPPAGATCNVVLYTNAGLSTEHADTDTSGEKLATRASSLIGGGLISFIGGASSALTANTAYWWSVDCGSERYRARGQFRTGASAPNQTLSFAAAHPTATTFRVEYATSPDFASSTVSDASFASARASQQLGFGSEVWFVRTVLLQSGATLATSAPRVVMTK